MVSERAEPTLAQAGLAGRWLSRHLLHAGCTRARERLLITYSGGISSYLTYSRRSVSIAPCLRQKAGRDEHVRNLAF